MNILPQEFLSFHGKKLLIAYGEVSIYIYIYIYVYIYIYIYIIYMIVVRACMRVQLGKY